MNSGSDSQAKLGFTYNKALFEFVFLAAALLCSIYYMQLRYAFNIEYGPGNLTALACNSAAKPFQYRALTPWCVGLIYKINVLPLSSLESIYRLWETCSVFLLIVSLRYYVNLFVKNNLTSAFLSFLVLLILPFNYLFPRQLPYLYPYDMPSLLFFTLALAFMHQKKWVMYYLVFVLGTFNRETTCFLTFVFLFTSFQREKMSTVLCHCLAQMVLWVGIKGTLLYMYASNPGPEGFEWYHANTSISHFSTNLAFLSDLRNYPFFLSNIAFIWLPVLFFHRLIRDNFARRSLLVVIPFFAGMMLVGNIYEIRIWGELIPVFLPGFSLVVMALFDNSENRLDNPSWQMPGNPPV